MAISVTCTNVVQDEVGRVIVSWDDSTTTEYQSISALYNACSDLDTVKGAARLWLLADWMRQDPGGNDTTKIIGKNCVVDSRSVDKVVIVAV